MMIGRLMLINSTLTLLMLGTPQAANIKVAGATNLSMPGKGIAALFRKNRHDTVLSFGARGESFGQINKPGYFSSFFRPTAFARADLAGTASRFPNAPSSMPHAGSCLWRSSAKFATSAETFEMPFFVKLSTFIRLAPTWGVAAAHAMTTLGVRETIQQKLLKWRALRKPIKSPKPAMPSHISLRCRGSRIAGPDRGG